MQKHRDVVIGLVILVIAAAAAGIIYALTKKPMALVVDPSGKVHQTPLSEMQSFLSGDTASLAGNYYNPAGSGLATVAIDGGADMSIDTFLNNTGGTGAVDDTLIAGDAAPVVTDPITTDQSVTA